MAITYIILAKICSSIGVPNWVIVFALMCACISLTRSIVRIVIRTRSRNEY